MRRSILVGTLTGAAVVAAAALAYSAGAGSGPTRPALAAPLPSASLQAVPQVGSGQPSGIFVTGEGIITVKPDIARVTLGVEISDPSANGAQQKAANAMDPVISALKGQGIEEKDIQTVRFDLSPEYDYSTRTPVLKGYHVTNLVMVTLRDITKAGPLLDTVVGQGATRIYGINFDVSDPAAAGAQGREEAMKQARDKADQLARLAGVTLGRPISIEEQVSAAPAPVEMRAAPAMAAPQASTPVSPGTQEVHTVIRVTFSIQ